MSTPTTVGETLAERMYAKFFAFWLTDEDTPIIGDLASKAVSLWKGETDPKSTANWFSKYPKEDQFPNDRAEWMFDQPGLEACEFNHDAFYAWLEQCSTYEELLACPTFGHLTLHPKYDLPVVVNDDLVVEGPSPSLESNILEDSKDTAAHSKRTKKRRRRRGRGKKKPQAEPPKGKQEA
jgi:hypothetical protein